MFSFLFQKRSFPLKKQIDRSSFLLRLEKVNEFPRKERDLLDILDTYKYMNQAYFWESVEFDGRWDHAQGWVQLNHPESEWKFRLAEKFPPQSPEGAKK
ncbi:hypothetical protein [Leptospira ilyithenensis]|uniref:hypothetical protein n=1 Tax=Leptospira ilyithenensis TaxID=2484901 RepID=UPI001FE72741|nr:hypothetical protein [Leptospira ilyithenensis]